MDPSPFTCLACAQRFADADQQRDHFKLDWHRYNLKRKLAGVPPVTRDAFERRRLAGAEGTAPAAPPTAGAGSAPPPPAAARTVYQCTPCRAQFSSENAYTSHARSKKHRTALAAATASATPAVAAAGGASPLPDAPVVLTLPPKPTEAPSTTTTMTEEEAEEAAEEAAIAIMEELSPAHCVFCTAVSDDVGSNLTHMAVAHSFFVPDAAYLEDAEGFVMHLLEKVHVRNVCLRCNRHSKVFATADAVRLHMSDKGHSSIPYETESDMEEYDEFFDYSTALKAPLRLRRRAAAAARAPRGDASDDASDDGGDDDESYDESITEDDDDEEEEGGAVVSASGELLLPDGRIIGHRQYARYYRQKYSPAETRDSVVKTRLALEYGKLGVAMLTSSAEVSAARAAIQRRHAEERFGRNLQRKLLRLGQRNNKTTQTHFRVQMMQ